MVQLNFIIITMMISILCTCKLDAYCGQETTNIPVTTTDSPYNKISTIHRNTVPTTIAYNRIVTNTQTIHTTILFPYYSSTASFRNSTTKLTTTTISIPSTTIEYGQCRNYTRKTGQFGGIGPSFYSVYFNVLISDLKSFEISSGTYVHSFSFLFKNGSSLFYGSQKTNRIKVKTSVNIEGKQIVAARGSSDRYWLENVQFLIYDQSENSYTWTAPLNEQADTFSVNAQNNEPFSSHFIITSISGYAHPNYHLGTAGFEYTYNQCNSVDTILTNPSIVFTQKADILPTVSVTSTFLLEDSY